MDELVSLRTFVQVVEDGSFSATARRAHSSVSSVARQVKFLEDTLGTRLLNKTTRSQALTDAGDAFYRRTKAILDELDRAKRDASSYQSSIKGLLRVSLRISAGSEVIVPALPRFLASHPELQLEVIMSDERTDLVATGIDVAVWLGHLQDSSMIARRLSPSPRVVVGSAAYFKKYGRPKHPRDLVKHNCVFSNARNYGNVWRFTRGAEKIDVTVSGTLRSASSSVLFASVRLGLGLTVLPKWMVRNALSAGQVETVLSDYRVTPTEYDSALYVVYPHARGLSPKARVFVDFLTTLFREHN